MKILGLDIGTTTVSAVVIDGGKVLSSVTLPNGSFLHSENPWEKIQDPDYIRNTALKAVDRLLAQHPEVERIGVTGQMHGIVYLDRNGEPVSPLYTWQDGRGDQLYNGTETYASYLTRRTGYQVATGYGLVTHAYNLAHHLVPQEAGVLCTIHDYIAMVLAGKKLPVTEESDAASLGLFDVKHGCFDVGALDAVGISKEMLPEIAADRMIGHYRGKIPVFAAIGDNQASFLGAANGNLNTMLVNVGTGSQFSVYSREYIECAGLETRPFPGGYLIVGASLCGGRAYAMLESFMRLCAEAMTGENVESCYGAMDQLLRKNEMPDDLPQVTPLFQGTRHDPSLRGSITNISTENFTPKHLIWAMLEGMTRELYNMYQCYLQAGGAQAQLVGSGNGLRKNVYLQGCISRAFGQEVLMSDCCEEAAVGAALYAAMQLA